ncbi:MAG: ribonuclease PH [Candidatus Methylacidiphilales bacterium]|nr:ribonuclease PH [Candidatus Methylacidiphilales bacterium]
MSRHDGRRADQLRPFRFTPHIAPNATGSVLARCGRTEVICAVTIQEGVPRWMKEQGVTGGWVTAEYSMLPYSTLERKQRDITKGRIDGRSQEIQRLIGRSLRAVVDLEALGSRTLCVDCDVLSADGGTRTTAITGTWLALRMASKLLVESGRCSKDPVRSQLGAISVGVVQSPPPVGTLRDLPPASPALPSSAYPDRQVVLDLDYIEDKDAAVDMNVVMNGGGEFIEVQAAGEEATFSRAQLDALLSRAEAGIRDIFALQNEALASFPPHPLGLQSLPPLPPPRR